MRRLASLLLLPLITPLAAAQVDCEVACTLPPEPPAECICLTGIHADTSSTLPQPRDAQELLRWIQEDYERSIAEVENVTVVLYTSLTPLPVVQYFEKEVIGDTPVFRQISPVQLKEREAEAQGAPTPRQMGEGLATILGAVRGRASSEDVPDAVPPAAASALGGFLKTVADGLAGMFEALQNPTSFDSGDDLIERIWQSEEFQARARVYGVGDVSDNMGGYFRVLPKYVVRVVAEDLDDLDLGEGSEDYYLHRVSMWTTCWYSTSSDPDLNRKRMCHPIAIEAEIVDRTTTEHATIRRIHTDWRRTGPTFKPFKTIDAIGGRIGGATPPIAEVITWIDVILVNEGAPTQEQIAVLSQTAMDRNRGR